MQMEKTGFHAFFISLKSIFILSNLLPNILATTVNVCRAAWQVVLFRPIIRLALKQVDDGVDEGASESLRCHSSTLMSLLNHSV